jgi:hypothetical protein
LRSAAGRGEDERPHPRFRGTERCREARHGVAVDESRRERRACEGKAQQCRRCAIRRSHDAVAVEHEHRHCDRVEKLAIDQVPSVC